MAIGDLQLSRQQRSHMSASTNRTLSMPICFPQSLQEPPHPPPIESQQWCLVIPKLLLNKSLVHFLNFGPDSRSCFGCQDFTALPFPSQACTLHTGFPKKGAFVYNDSARIWFSFPDNTSGPTVIIHQYVGIIQRPWVPKKCHLIGFDGTPFIPMRLLHIVGIWVVTSKFYGCF